VKALRASIADRVDCRLSLKTVAALAMVLVAEARRRGLRLSAASAVDVLAPRAGDLMTPAAVREVAEEAARRIMSVGAPLCSACGVRAATCVGRHEAAEADEAACDECCAHGCEDGLCRPLEGAVA